MAASLSKISERFNVLEEAMKQLCPNLAQNFQAARNFLDNTKEMLHKEFGTVHENMEKINEKIENRHREQMVKLEKSVRLFANKL